MSNSKPPFQAFQSHSRPPARAEWKPTQLIRMGHREENPICGRTPSRMPKTQRSSTTYITADQMSSLNNLQFSQKQNLQQLVSTTTAESHMCLLSACRQSRAGHSNNTRWRSSTGPLMLASDKRKEQTPQQMYSTIHTMHRRLSCRL